MTNIPQRLRLEKSTPELSERIQVARVVGGISLRDWANACGVERDYLSKLKERCKRPTDAHLEILCTETGANMAFLLNPEPISIVEEPRKEKMEPCLAHLCGVKGIGICSVCGGEEEVTESVYKDYVKWKDL